MIAAISITHERGFHINPKNNRNLLSVFSSSLFGPNTSSLPSASFDVNPSLELCRRLNTSSKGKFSWNPPKNWQISTGKIKGEKEITMSIVVLNRTKDSRLWLVLNLLQTHKHSHHIIINSYSEIMQIDWGKLTEKSDKYNRFYTYTYKIRFSTQYKLKYRAFNKSKSKSKSKFNSKHDKSFGIWKFSGEDPKALSWE